MAKPGPALEALAAAMPESELLGNVRDLARMLGWLGYHTRRSTGSDVGFPDLVLVRRSRLVVAELKTATGKPTRWQQDWLDAFGDVDAVEVYLWRPADWLSGVIGRVLR